MQYQAVGKAPLAFSQRPSDAVTGLSYEKDVLFGSLFGSLN